MGTSKAQTKGTSKALSKETSKATAKETSKALAKGPSKKLQIHTHNPKLNLRQNLEYFHTCFKSCCHSSERILEVRQVVSSLLYLGWRKTDAAELCHKATKQKNELK